VARTRSRLAASSASTGERLTLTETVGPSSNKARGRLVTDQHGQSRATVTQKGRRRWPIQTTARPAARKLGLAAQRHLPRPRQRQFFHLPDERGEARIRRAKCICRTCPVITQWPGARPHNP
jgi:hypothetical protein